VRSRIAPPQAQVFDVVEGYQHGLDVRRPGRRRPGSGHGEGPGAQGCRGQGTGLNLIGITQVNDDTDAGVVRRFPSGRGNEPRIG